MGRSKKVSRVSDKDSCKKKKKSLYKQDSMWKKDIVGSQQKPRDKNNAFHLCRVFSNLYDASERNKYKQHNQVWLQEYILMT